MGKYIVKDENTLGYIIREYPTTKNVVLVVLAVDVAAGGDPLLLNRPTIAAPGSYRYATKEDGDKFMIKI